ncbi:GUCY1B [Mytilus coruscus]|uniref:GUCY1B n=1 Tax=Mytilus coruscus TaxID=42192 RepID=A0A6J8AFU7_MYTCO|nr:GUCY1B [Mytilus coruscus]
MHRHFGTSDEIYVYGTSKLTVSYTYAYGQIHLPIKDMVLDKFGGKAWKEILIVSGLDDETDFLVFQSYPDDKTFALLRAVSSVSDFSGVVALTGMPYDTVLEEFGDYFVQYCFRHGYDQLLRTLGKDFISFIQNLDTLHSYLARTYTQLRFPSFRCERRNADSVNLHYLTERTGLHPLVIGLAKAVARDIYHHTAEMEVESISTHESDTGSEREHVVFIVQFKDVSENEKVVVKYDKQPFTSVLSVSHICTALPYHIVFDENLQIKQYGNMISKLLQTNLPPNTYMTSLFSIMHPPMKFLVENILMFSNSVFYLSLKKTDRTDNPLILREKQLDSVKSILENKDCFIVLPTGYGKSRIYFHLPELFEMTTTKKSSILVISPLQALMLDQMKKLQDMGITATVVGECQKDKGLWRRSLTSGNFNTAVKAVIIDEAHCITEWGAEFRQEYSMLDELRSIFPEKTPFVALTGTATKEMKFEIMKKTQHGARQD